MANAISNLGRLVPNIRGAYDAEVQYNVLDEAFYNGATYRVKFGDVPPVGTAPTNTTYWSQTTAKGAQVVSAVSSGNEDGTFDITFTLSDDTTATVTTPNLAGPTGVSISSFDLTDNEDGTYTFVVGFDDTSEVTLTTGDLTGPIGPAPGLVQGTITTLSPGASATFELVEDTPGNYTLNLGIPKGDTGSGDVSSPAGAVVIDDVVLFGDTGGSLLKTSGIQISSLVTSTALTSALGDYVLTANFDLDTISEGTTNKYYTATEQTKVGYISITQAVDLDAIETRVNALDAAVILKGTWDASAGTFPGSGDAQAGESWIVSVAGTVDSVEFAVNDRIIAITDDAATDTYSANWHKADYTDQVLSVAGRTGAITLSNSDISGLGSAATQDTSAFATATQGGKADTAVQPADVIPATSGGTGVANNVASTLTISGNFATTLVVPGAHSYTLPDLDCNIGFREIPQNSKSAAYTLVLSDSGKHILHPSADTTARTFTIPSNASVAFPIGTAVTFINQNGAGVVTISISSDTMRLAGTGTTGSRTLAANGIATAIKITSTQWIISGMGLT